MITGYLNQSVDNVCNQMLTDINEKTVKQVFQKLFASPNKVRLSRYFFSLADEEETYRTDGFFHTFKKRYTLQGLSNQFLDHLESNKHEIHMLLKKGELGILYFRFFQTDEPEKHLGAVFTRLTHTFFPHQYCSLDFQVKDYFGLRRDSYYIAMHIMSKAYLQVAAQYPEWLEQMKITLQQKDEYHFFRHEQTTDIKLLDLFYRTKVHE